MKVYLGLGSNMGVRHENIARACELLARHLTEIKAASLYETAPQDVLDQPPFLNTVVVGRTELDAITLLDSLHSIENALGRDRRTERRKGPRPIDIDLLLYGSAVIAGERLEVPHPRMSSRKFVLIPLLELDPGLVDPAESVPFADYLARLPPQGIYYFGATRYSL